ncbi:hypothetical protein DIPPA_32219 [Diplonema papillatum]|nr:hypothetical protein DIPPA_32219 [Diplonema papillatum]
MFAPRSIVTSAVPVVAGGTPEAVQSTFHAMSARIVGAQLADGDFRASLSPRRDLTVHPISAGVQADRNALAAKHAANATALYAEATVRAGSPLSPCGVAGPTYLVATSLSPRHASGSPVYSTSLSPRYMY